MTNGAASNERLGQLWNVDRRQYPRLNANVLKCVLKHHRIHYGGEHANVIGGSPIHVRGAGRNSAKDVATANHDCDLGVDRVGLFDFFSDAPRDVYIDPERLFAQESFTRKL